MTVEECYRQMGGDFSQLQRRFIRLEKVDGFLAKFLCDGSFAALRDALDCGDRVRAFEAAHTLKGICGNLSMDRLLHSVCALTEQLRFGSDAVPQEAYPLFEEVKKDYETVIRTIRKYLEAGG